MSGSFINNNRALVTVALRYKIRHATEPDNPALISQWLSLDSCPSYLRIDEQRVHYEQQFRLLLETIADELLPGTWRRACLDQIHKPLTALAEIAFCHDSIQRLNVLHNELRLTCDYVSASLNRPSL
ncbi:MAG: hypothetical protein V7731_23880 [Amphritea sp.]